MQGGRRYNLESNRMIELPQVWGRILITGAGEDGALMGRLRWRFPEGWRALHGIVSYADHVWGVRLEGRQAGEAGVGAEQIEDYFTQRRMVAGMATEAEVHPALALGSASGAESAVRGWSGGTGSDSTSGGSRSDIDWVEESMVFIGLGEPGMGFGFECAGNQPVFSSLDGFGGFRWLGLDQDKPGGSDPNLYDSFTKSYQEFCGPDRNIFACMVVQELVSMDQGYILRWDLAEVEPGMHYRSLSLATGEVVTVDRSAGALDPWRTISAPAPGRCDFA